MRRVPLLRRLVLAAAVGIVPVAAMSAAGLYLLVQQQQRQATSGGLELARALATGVDAELRSSSAVLQALAASRTLDRADLAGFRAEAQRVRSSQPHWHAVMLATPDGRRVFDTRFDAAPHEPIIEARSFATVVRTRAPAVGNLTEGLDHRMNFPVRVPVVRDGRLQYVLTAIVDPTQILEVVQRQRAPADWVISIFDANNRRVARSRAHAENLGGAPSPSLQVLMAGGGAEGVGLTFALEGDRIYTAYSRLKDSGWTAAPGIPATVVEQGALRSFAVYAGGVVASLLVGTIVAVWMARRINQPMAELRAAAHAMGRGEAPRVPATSIQEIRDVADALVTAASQRQELLQNERQARQEAEEAARAKDQFLAILSHELRTPLNAVLGWAKLLSAGRVQPERQSDALNAILRNADAQLKLIDDLLDVSRIITGKMRLDVQPLDLHDVVVPAVDAMRPAADAKEIRLDLVFDPNVGLVTGDPSRLQQVVWNLVANAVKFTPRGGRVEVHVSRAESNVAIVVRDNGEGIAPELLPVVFERFRQGDSSSTRSHAGLGLGLALARHLVEQHGGTLTAQSAGRGKGATFVVNLPARSPQPIPSDDARRNGVAAATSPRLDGVRVLVVDDDADGLELTRAILVADGAEVATCRSAAAALAMFPQWRPHVLVSDIEMPGEDGYTLIERVRALGRELGARTPALALTGYGSAGDRQRALAAGYDVHVAKPVDPGELTAIVASLATRSPKA